ncbi:GNAT family N-acetyltransferase [Marinicellulosiphila megalodicopiae]|uniref:GNAT family N-acetyltransferase n=1 Tax=Marinicellulosiphila megalodicopiae TaxID=2724896 RepID=UPI003BAE7779
MDNQIKIIQCKHENGFELAELRARAMKPSLETVGRFDEKRVRSRFLEGFVPEETFKIEFNNELAGFYVIQQKEDHLYLNHLYIDPQFQGNKLGAFAINEIKKVAKNKKSPIKLGALKQSRSNDFYQSHGFIHTHDDEFDHYYIWKH